MTFVAVPIKMISSPNEYANLNDNQWVVTQGAAATLWFQLYVQDELGTRRYIVPSGGTIQVVFPRADSSAQANTTGNVVVTSQSVTKAVTLDVSDRSMGNFAISAADADKIISGTVKFSLTVGSVVNAWLQNWAVKKVTAQAAR
jgi:hypothetical protein